MRLGLFLMVVTCFTACTSRQSATKVSTPPVPQTTGQVSLPPPPAPPQASAPAEEKLDASLLALVRASRTGAADVALKQLPPTLEVKSDKVKVDIAVVRTAPIADVRKRILGLGAEITAEIENHVWAFVSPAAIDQLTRDEAVWTIHAATPSVSTK